MKFKQVYDVVGHLPCTEETQCRMLYDWIIESRPKECLELGFLYGKTSCVIAAALHEIGEGHLTSLDMEAVRNHHGNSNILDNLGKADLQAFVTPVFSQVSYTWELKKIIEANTKGNQCYPFLDFIFLDGAHIWEPDVCAFFLAMKLLKPGGWFLFDDYMFTIAKSDWWSRSPEMEGKPADYRNESQVERLVTLVVSQHPDIESVLIRDNWVWARKKADITNSGGPSVAVLTKTIAKRWLMDKVFRWRRWPR
jgi:predicted O-methyltransferase YrrM